MPGVFKAASPHFAYLFFMHNPKEGWIALGSIALSFSGVEAMSADMGHFSRSSITVPSAPKALSPITQHLQALPAFASGTMPKGWGRAAVSCQGVWTCQT